MANLGTLEKATVQVKDPEGNIIPPELVTIESSQPLNVEVYDEGGLHKVRTGTPGTITLTAHVGASSGTLEVTVANTPLVVELIDVELDLS